jgi:hypothetical protein
LSRGFCELLNLLEGSEPEPEPEPRPLPLPMLVPVRSLGRRTIRQRERHRLLRIIKKCPVIAPHMSVKKGTDEDEESGASAGE